MRAAGAGTLVLLRRFGFQFLGLELCLIRVYLSKHYQNSQGAYYDHKRKIALSKKNKALFQKNKVFYSWPRMYHNKIFFKKQVAGEIVQPLRFTTKHQETDSKAAAISKQT